MNILSYLEQSYKSREYSIVCFTNVDIIIQTIKLINFKKLKQQMKCIK